MLDIVMSKLLLGLLLGVSLSTIAENISETISFTREQITVLQVKMNEMKQEIVSLNQDRDYWYSKYQEEYKSNPIHYF